MDLSVRFRDKVCNEVKPHYLGSVFLGQAKATELLKAFKTGIQGLDPAKVLQVSMDGPNINWALLKLMERRIKCYSGPRCSSTIRAEFLWAACCTWGI